MPNRIIKESICTSEEIDKLNSFQETVFYRLIVNCDDYGRIDARAKILKSKLFPLKDVSTEAIEDALKALSSAELVILYHVNGRPFLQMKTWDRHQRVRSKISKYPAPADGCCQMPASCGQMISDDIKCPRNPIQSNTNTESIYENTNARAREEEKDRFEEFWAVYPRKSGDIKQAYFEYLGVIQSGVDEQTLIDAVKWQAEEKGRYMPNAEKWLRNMGWTEQKQEPKQKSSGRNDPAACKWTQEEQSAAIAQMMREIDALGDKI